MSLTKIMAEYRNHRLEVVGSIIAIIGIVLGIITLVLLLINILKG